MGGEVVQKVVVVGNDLMKVVKVQSLDGDWVGFSKNMT